MRLLLDTHTFLWWASGDERLSKPARTAIESPGAEVLLSTASIWEACIKWQLGKLPLPEHPSRYLPTQLAKGDVAPLDIRMHHVLHITELPDHHNDPFDRIIISQARMEDMTIVTRDENIRRYDVKTLW